MEPIRHKRKLDINKRLSFIKSSLPYPEPSHYQDFLIQLVTDLLEEAKDLFKDGDLKEAEKEFSEGLNVYEYASVQGVKIPDVLLESLHMNRAAAHHSLKEYKKAVKDCDDVLQFNKESCDALYRKALCLRDMGLLREAYNCTTDCLLLSRLDKQVNDLAQELAVLLGLKTRNPYVSSKASGAHVETDKSSVDAQNISAAVSTYNVPLPSATFSTFLQPSAPVPKGIIPLPESELLDEDLDNLLDGFSAVQTETPAALSNHFSTPNHIMPSRLPVPTPQLPPAFFHTAVSQLNTPASGEETTLDSLDELLPSHGLDSLDDFLPVCTGTPSLMPTAAAGLDTLDSLCDAAPSSKFAMANRGEKENLKVLFAKTHSLEKPTNYQFAGSNGNLLDQLDFCDGVVSTGVESLDSLSDFSTSGLSDFPAAVSPKNNHRKMNASNNVLSNTHEFLQACVACFPRQGQGINTFVHKPNLVHNCERDILLCRRKSNVPLKWTRIREIPTWTSFNGPFVLCKELINSGDLGLCKYGEDCTFAFNQLEIDVWTQERKGTLDRNLLFELSASVRDPVANITRLLQENKGTFIFVCKECFDGKPRIISKRLKMNPSICSNQDVSHNFDANKCLAFLVRTTTINYKKVRPLNVLCQLDICHKAVRFGCPYEEDCPYAHSTIELKTWKIQRSTGISPEEIVKVATHFYEMERKPTTKFAEASPGHRKAASAAGKQRNLNMNMKFVCAQCWRDGRVTEPDKVFKYCSARARHLWKREQQILMVRLLDKAKWAQVRPLPHTTKNFPSHYELCNRILEKNKCTVANCTFAHSEEEKDMWMYMKNKELHDMQQMYDMWLTLSTQSQPPESSTHTQPKAEEKCIAMPTDNVEQSSGLHCRLCGKYSNSERQWQQHISTEKHKDRVFSCEGEEETLTWSYRFPGKKFQICPKLGGTCPDSVSCDFAHSAEELQEWTERRDFLRKKLAKAKEELLIMPDEFNFGKYNYLLES